MSHENNLRVKPVLGFDIGGTQIKAAVVAAEGKILTAHRIPTPSSLTEFCNAMKQLIQNLHLPESGISGVGIGCKGIISPATTEVLALPGGLHYLEGRRLNELITPLLEAPYPFAADNDARVALEGERRWGAARGRENVLMLTLGTGVGGAILVDGKILRGAGGAAGHAGHLTVESDGVECICGNRGCLETAFSARAIESAAFAAIHRGVATELHNLTARPPTCADVFECARRGDVVARDIVQHAILLLGGAVAGLVHVLDPEIVILGGQIAESGELLFSMIQRELDWRTKTLLRRSVPVVKSELADPSGVLGAAALAFDAVASPPK
jgi:glucokinase